MMRLTSREEMAIAILVACAQWGETWTTTTAVAASVAITRERAAQVIHRLTRAGLIETRRGHAGGIRLAGPASEMTLRRVLETTARWVVEGRPSRDVESDELGMIVAAASQRSMETYAGFTIADLVQGNIAAKLASTSRDLGT